MRDFGVIGFSFSGDESLGKRYVAHARTRMGIMNNYMLLHGLPSCIRNETLPDGTKISLTHLPGGIKRIHIDTQNTIIDDTKIFSGIVLLPSSNEVPNGWGHPFEDDYGKPINPPLGTENGDHPYSIIKNSNIYRSKLWYDNQKLKDNISGLTQKQNWHSFKSKYVLNYDASNKDRYSEFFWNRNNKYIYYRDIVISPPKWYDQETYTIISACINTQTNKLFCICSEYSFLSNGVETGFKLHFYCREWNERGYENDELYDINSNKFGWRYVGSIDNVDGKRILSLKQGIHCNSSGTKAVTVVDTELANYNYLLRVNFNETSINLEFEKVYSQLYCAIDNDEYIYCDGDNNVTYYKTPSQPSCYEGIEIRTTSRNTDVKKEYILQSNVFDFRTIFAIDFYEDQEVYFGLDKQIHNYVNYEKINQNYSYYYRDEFRVNCADNWCVGHEEMHSYTEQESLKLFTYRVIFCDDIIDIDDDIKYKYIRSECHEISDVEDCPSGECWMCWIDPDYVTENNRYAYSGNGYFKTAQVLKVKSIDLRKKYIHYSLERDIIESEVVFDSNTTPREETKNCYHEIIEFNTEFGETIDIQPLTGCQDILEGVSACSISCGAGEYPIVNENFETVIFELNFNRLSSPFNQGILYHDDDKFIILNGIIDQSKINYKYNKAGIDKLSKIYSSGLKYEAIGVI